MLKGILLLILFMGSLTAKCPLPREYIEKIDRYLQPFREGITPAMVERLRFIGGCLITIRGHRANSKCPYKKRRLLHDNIKAVAKYLPDMQFLYNDMDQPRILKHNNKPNCPARPNPIDTECYCDQGFKKPAHAFFTLDPSWSPLSETLPVFSSATISSCFNDILIPSWQHFQYFHQMPEQVLVPWQEKEFKAFWRGGLNAGNTNIIEDLRATPRIKLVELCRKLKYCDAQISDHKAENKPEIIVDILRKKYPQAPFMSHQEQSKFKIIIDIDGITFSERFTNVLKLGSAVFKIADFEDIGTLAVRPWEHYVPVKMDLSDFEEKLEWARANDDQLRAIGARGRARSLEVHTLDIYHCYLRTVLLRYYDLLVKGGATACMKKPWKFSSLFS